MSALATNLATSSFHPTDLAAKVRMVEESIKHTQSGSTGRYVCFTHDPTGFGAQVSRRILAIRIGLLTGRTAVFPQEDCFPYENPFEPISIDAPAEWKNSPTIDLTHADRDNRPVVRFDFWDFWRNEKLKRYVYSSVPQEIEDVRNSGILLDGIIFSTFQLRGSYSEAVAPYLSQIDAIRPVVGVHFRRGDKYVETPYVDPAVYRESISHSAEIEGTNNIFIASDSPRALFELQLDARRYNIHFDTEEKRYNNANHKFLSNRPDLSHQETLSAIKNIYMLGQCDRVVGQSNAHFALLAAGRISARTNATDFGRLIEPAMLPNKRVPRLIYQTYRATRSMAKTMLYFANPKR
jgi:hypothetical protein